MSQNSLSKQRKRKARERRVAEKQRHQDDRRHYMTAFPKFVFRPNNAPDGFVDLIRGAVRRIDFRDRALFRPTEMKFLRLAKQKPVEVFSALLAGAKVGNPLAVHFTSFVGQTVFDLIPTAELRQWIPFHDVQFFHTGSEIVADFRSLEQAKGRAGTIYFSRHRPTLEIDGQRRVVGWSRHAVERTCERLGPRWESYLGLGDVFAFFDQCRHFEPARLHGDQIGFTFYADCDPGFFTGLFAENVLGGLGAKPSYYRVGYCPAVVDGEFLMWGKWDQSRRIGKVIATRNPDGTGTLANEIVDEEVLRKCLLVPKGEETWEIGAQKARG